MKNRIYQCVKLQDPQILIHIHPSIREKPDALSFQQGPPQLREASARDGSILHHNALPGQAVRAEAHGAADLCTRTARLREAKAAVARRLRVRQRAGGP